MDSNYLVAQGNELIEARQKEPLTAREQKIVLTMVSMIQPEDHDFKDYEISISDFTEMLGLAGREKYTEIKEITKTLVGKVIEIPRKNGGWLLTHWVSSAEYVDGEGVIKLSFSPKLKPYLLQLKRAYTSYRLSNILSIKSAYAIRLYELMKKWQHVGTWEIPVESLREKLGAITKTYSLYGNLKNRVIVPSVKEVNEKTDVHVEFKEIRKGRKVVKIEFKIKHCKEKEIKIKKPSDSELNQELFDELTDLANFKLSLKGFKRVENIAKKIYQENYMAQLKLLVEIINLRIKQTNVENPMGLMIYIIEDKEELFNKGYDPRIEQTSKEVIPDWFKNRKKPNNQPELTQEELEKEREEIAEILAKFKSN